MWWGREFYPRSRPRQARGGIKAQSKRGQFGQSWWARRWIEVLESFDIGARLGRGRSYARNGQVLQIDVSEGKVTAKVQGSMREPYRITIGVKALSAKDWGRVVEALAGQALFAAKLLAGEMPPDVEKVFADAGVSLFPGQRGDLETSCSCPDWSNPCKHVAAVYYLLGEEFDRDPFLIFRLRGLGREALCARLGERAAPPDAGAAEEAAAEAREPLPADTKSFWAVGELPGDLFGEVARPPVAAAWPRRLGSFPFWRGHEHFLDALEGLYREAGRTGLVTFLGERFEAAGGAGDSGATLAGGPRAAGRRVERGRPVG
jgi:uncharacterized Zn finger protein